jgi:hypothetical protein
MTSIFFALRSIEYLEVSAGGLLLRSNEAFAERMGSTAAELAGASAERFLAPQDAARLARWIAGSQIPEEVVLLNFCTPAGEVYSRRCVVSRDGEQIRIVAEADEAENRQVAERLLQFNGQMAVLMRESERRNEELSRTRAELATALKELQNSHWHLKRLQEHLPVCMECGKIKADESSWASLVDYLQQNQILVTHGYCPACVEQLSTSWGLLEAEGLAE